MYITPNDTVSVLLTSFGAEIVNKKNKANNSLLEGMNIKPLKTNYKDGDRYEAELWNIMRLFGPHCYNGNSIAFKSMEKVN